VVAFLVHQIQIPCQVPESHRRSFQVVEIQAEVLDDQAQRRILEEAASYLSAALVQVLAYLLVAGNY